MTEGVQRTPEELEALKRKILDYFPKTPGGTFAAACKSANVAYSTAYEWRAKDPAFNQAVIDARRTADDLGGDFAESKLMEAINNNELTGIIFYLKTKHKTRGYIEKHIQSHEGGDTPITVNGSIDEQIARLLKGV